MKAIVLGATGLVGRQLLKQLLADSRFEKVITFTRKPTGESSAKLEEHLIDFDKPETWQHLVKGDVLFSAFGTTIKTAGSQEAQYKIDYTYQYLFAMAAATNGVPVYVLVSAAGSSPKSMLFYSRMKGELERDVRILPFRSIHILRPGMLAGDRQEHRAGEKIFTPIIKFLSFIPGLGNIKPIYDREVAKIMITVATNGKDGKFDYEPAALFKLG